LIGIWTGTLQNANQTLDHSAKPPWLEEWLMSYNKKWKDCCLLGCSAVYSGRNLPKFQRSLLPLSSGRALKMEAVRTSETLVNFYQTIRRYSPEDSHLRTHRR
jgi:hypothetical protein